MDPMFLHHELEFSAINHRNKIAVVSPSIELTYEQLNGRASSLAAALQSLELNCGDRLAILGHNSVDYITWHYAAAKAGIILHVLNTRLVNDELKWMIDNAESIALIADGDFYRVATELKNSCPSIKFLIGMEGEDRLKYSTDSLISQNHTFSPAKFNRQSAALMIYTSGTTGRPKGALQSHGGSVLADMYTRDAVGINEQDIYLALMPFFHQAGLIRTRATLLAGGKCIIPGKVDATEAANIIAEDNVTFTMIASAAQNTAIRKKLSVDGPEVFEHLRIILGGGGGGARAVKTIESMCSALNCDYFGVYGQTETTGPAVYITGKDVFERPTSCGKPFPGVDIEIWDEKGKSLEAEEEGEIVIRGPITAKYWRNDEANEALYEGPWIHTGDIGCLDKDGFLYFKGRIKELVKTGAENVYPREVEAVLEQHPNIADVAIIGLPDREWGEVVCAVIVTREKADLTLEEIRQFCRNKIGGYKIPKRILITDAIPRNHTGKILRQPLIQQALNDN